MIRLAHGDYLHKYAAQLVIEDAASIDTIQELEDAERDLEEALDGSAGAGYEDKVKSNLISLSNAKTYDEAKLEWVLKNQWASPGGTCQLCGHNPITYHFQIKNKLNDHTLILGSECILNYVTISGFTREELRLYLTRLRQRLHDRKFQAVDDTTIDVWEKQDAIYGSMKSMLAKLPDDFDILEYKQQIQGFRKIAGFKLSDSYSKFIRAIDSMTHIMIVTYKTTKLKEIPDKIRRKQKEKGRKLTDEQKLGLYIGFERQLEQLFQFGSPQKGYELIQQEYKKHLEGSIDDVDARKASTQADICRYFTDMKKSVGSRTSLKEYINKWQQIVLDLLEERYTDYIARVSDIDSTVSGKAKVFTPPSEYGKDYIYDGLYLEYLEKHKDEDALHSYLMSSKYEYYDPKHTYQINSVDLKSAILDCLDKNDLSVGDLNKLGIHPGKTVFVNRDAIDSFKILRERLNLVKSGESIANKNAELEYRDLIKDAEDGVSGDWEQKFVADLGHRYTTKDQLSTKQLEKLMSIAIRKSIPRARSKSKFPLLDFLNLCKETMRPGSEKGFIESLINRRIRSWEDLSEKQQKWLEDIYTRDGKRMPDNLV